MRRAVQRKREKESWIQHGVGIRNVKWLMQLLNPQQEHAQPGATTRLSAYLYGGADSEAGWTGWDGGKSSSQWVTGHKDVETVCTCAMVNWAASQAEIIDKNVFLSFSFEQIRIYDEAPPPSQPTDWKFISSLDSFDLSLPLLFSGVLKSKI